MTKFYTIKEIAKLAEVSTGTVDRVLHKRGKVSPDKADRVEAILKKIDYKPNQLARSLKLNKRYRFVILLPDDELDEYWKPCFAGVEELKSNFEANGMLVDVLKYSPHSPDNFVEMAQKSMDLSPDAVLLGALFLKESREYLQKLEGKGIPFNLINTEVEGVNFSTFVGQNLVQSGRTAAHLFDTILPQVKSVLVLHMEEEFENAIHMQQKEIGFQAYFSERNRTTNIQTLNIKTSNPESIADQINRGISDKVDGIFVTTSKAFLLGENGIDLGVPVIGYDLLEKNIHYLKSGKIKFLIYQNPRLQAFQGLSLLSEQVMKKTQNPMEVFLPIEIISSENVSSYRS